MPAIKQTISWWCYNHSGPAPEQLVGLAAAIGYRGFDLVDQQYWPLIKEHGLEIAAVNGHQSIADGLNRTANHDRIEREIAAKLELARKWNIANLIVFSGNRGGLDDEAGAEATVTGLQRVARAAEDAGVTLALELLNSKVDHARLPGGPDSLGREGLLHGELAAREAAVRHLPHADHGRRYHPHHSQQLRVYRALPYGRGAGTA